MKAFPDYITFLLSDEESLYDYYTSERPVTLKDIRRRLMLLAHEQNTSAPDHFYRLGEKFFLGKYDFLSQLFTEGLVGLAQKMLEWRENKIYVKGAKMHEWQQLLPYLPPLLILSVYMFKDCPVSTCANQGEYISRFVLPNVRYTAMPSPYIPQMEMLCRSQHGLSDLHMHLNGSLESDIVWKDILCNIGGLKKELVKASQNPKVCEQQEFLSRFAKPDKFCELLLKAKELRHSLIEIVNTHVFPLEYDCYDLSHEAMLYIGMLQYLTLHREDDNLSSVFHYYLLIKGLSNKFLVQQPYLFGFEEFQKYTANGFREMSEKKYTRRFFQMAGNDLCLLRHLEGRFSPKENRMDNDALMSRIRFGWNKFISEQKHGELPLSELTLIAHFIKKEDKKSDSNIRHKLLRGEVKRKAHVVAETYKSKSENGRMIVGIDAAANEMDTPPEVFAPVYRELRKYGLKHFTYHAGEDFFHILSGLRSIFEAIRFLDLRRGDRIGHAMAAGVSVEVWAQNVGERILIRKGEYLDDLIFGYIACKQIPSLEHLIPRLESHIDRLSNDIYGDGISLYSLIKAWEQRCEDVLELEKNGQMDKPKYKWLKAYHADPCRSRYEEIIEVDPLAVLDESAISRIQLWLLKLMHDEEIVIETLPTSNVFIGSHRAFDTYHIANWLRWEEQGHPIPPIVLGTDDTGIFATNIYNEYCHVFTLLYHHCGFSADKALNFMTRLDNNSRIYSFRR